MTPLARGLLLGALQLALVASLGAKLLYDRERLPRVWVPTAPVDPELPIRGRYVQLRLMVPVPEVAPEAMQDALGGASFPVRLVVENNRLYAEDLPEDATVTNTLRIGRFGDDDSDPVAVLDPPVAYYFPDDAKDPSERAPGEELWVEVTVPPEGPPRPIRLGVRRDGKPIEPILY